MSRDHVAKEGGTLRAEELNMVNMVRASKKEERRLTGTLSRIMAERGPAISDLRSPNMRNQCETHLNGLSYAEERPNVTSATQEFRATKQDDNRESLRQSNRGIS